MAVEMPKTAPAKPIFGTLNEHLLCTLCNGYLVDATTIVECLHSFCRSCIVQYLQASSFCPRCEVQLDKGSPLRSLKPDKTLQDIVFKLVPNLFHNEMQRRRVYYDTHPQYADQTTPEQRGDCLERFYSPDDSISLSLEYHDRRKSVGKSGTSDQKLLPPKRYLKCPALFTVGLLKKFIRFKFDLPPEIMIDIFQRREVLADEYTLLDIAYIYPWKRSEPMQFFYRIRDPRVPESDEEVEREMPALSAAVVGGRPTRASRRASSASSLASPMASPRASPVPCAKRARLDPDDKDDATPPPAKLTSQPPSGTVQPKPKPAAPAPPATLPPVASASVPTSPPKVTTPTSQGPKITLTISPSRGTVTSTMTEVPKSQPAPPSALKSPTATESPRAEQPLKASVPVPKQTPAPKKNGTATPPSSQTKNGVGNGTPVPPKPFAATVTMKTANGGFVTVKNPNARAANGVMVGSKPSSTQPPNTPAPKLTASKSSAPKSSAPISSAPASLAPKPAQSTPGMPRPALQPAPAPRRNGLPLLAPKPDPKAAVENGGVAAKKGSEPCNPQDDEKNKVETAKAILQLSLGGFSKANGRCSTPTEASLHNRIDKIVQDLQDDESNDGALVIKSEPASPEGSPRGSPAPRDPVTTPVVREAAKPATSTPMPSAASLPPTLPKVNGLTITPIEPSWRKAANGTDNKRHSDSPLASAPHKMAKVDKVAEKLRQEALKAKGQDASKRPATPRPQGKQGNSPLTIQPKTFPPAQLRPLQKLLPKPPAPSTLTPSNPTPSQPNMQTFHPTQQSKPLPQQTKASPAAKGPAPAQQNQASKPASAPQGQPQAKPGNPSQGQYQAKPMNSIQGQQQAKPGLPPQVLPAKPVSATPNQVKPASAPVLGQQAKPSNAPQQGKHSSPQPPQMAKPTSTPPPQQGKPTTPQPVHPPKSSPVQHPKPTAQPNMTTQPSKPSPTNQSIKKVSSPETSPMKSKKPIPDLQRLQRPALSGTTVNGSLSLNEVKEQLAKKGKYSPPSPNRTPPFQQQQHQQGLPQKKPAPVGPGPRDGFGALDLSAASPRATDHGGSWTPPPSLAQTLAKRQQLMRPPPSLSSLSSSSPSPPADSPVSSVSPDLEHSFHQNLLVQQQAMLRQLQFHNLFQAQQQQVGLSEDLKKAFEGWSATGRSGFRATAKRK